MIMSVRLLAILGVMIRLVVFMHFLARVFFPVVGSSVLLRGAVGLVAVKGFGVRCFMRVTAIAMIVLFAGVDRFGLVRMIGIGIVRMAVIVSAVAASGQQQRHCDDGKVF
ncbi:MAG: hypothetical protein RQ741_06565 [Wenzhouxiangellaceae bacterium]|nr:hypothetical protein [Wenzhouxiangellaceae bacterium]